MPTRSDFEAAAAKFDAAALQVDGLTTAVEGVDASAILRGGSLGRQVPARIMSAVTTAQSCRGLIEVAADTCRERAMLIAEYEVQLERYDRDYDRYRSRLGRWRSRFEHWASDESGEVAHPGNAPNRPNKPLPPPAWAEVRRP